MDKKTSEIRAAATRNTNTEYTQWHSKYKKFVLTCPWCHQPIIGRPDYHEWLIKRNTVPPKKQKLIFHKYNIVPLHQVCHATYGQTRPMAKAMLFAAAAHYGAAAIAQWYIDLQKHKLRHLRKGTVCKPAAIEMADLGMRIHHVSYENWQTIDGDFRITAGLIYQGKMKEDAVKRTKMNGITIDEMIKYIDEGGYLGYLLGIVGKQQGGVK